MKTSRSLFGAAFLVLLTLASFAQVRADTIVIPGKTVKPPKDRPDIGPLLLISIKIKDKEGKEVTLDAGIVDSGNNDRIVLSAADTAKLGLDTGSGVTAKVPGGQVNAQKTEIPADRGGSFVGEKDSNQGFKASVAGPVRTYNGNLTMIGTSFFNTDPNGPGAVVVNYAAEEMVIYNNEQAKKLKHASLDLSSPMTAVVQGTFDVDPDGHAYTVDVSTLFGTNAASSPFVLSTGVSTTLISSDLAAALGITSFGPPIDFTYALGTFSVPSALVGLNVFSQQGIQPFRVGILPDALNPDRINVLGANFFGQYSSIELNAATSTFYATPVPEPSAFLTIGGLLALGGASLWLKRQRRGS